MWERFLQKAYHLCNTDEWMRKLQTKICHRSSNENSGIIRSASIAKLILRKCPAWRTWTSQRVYLNFTLFLTCFFARSSPSTHRNWASAIQGECCCKHATFPCWSFFILSKVVKVSNLKFVQCSSWTSCCFHVELLWCIFICNFLIHSSVLHKWYSFCTNLSHNNFFNFLWPRTWTYNNKKIGPCLLIHFSHIKHTPCSTWTFSSFIIWILYFLFEIKFLPNNNWTSL